MTQPKWPQFNIVERNAEIKAFFRNLASNYDTVEEHSYWEFSDQILWNLLKNNYLQSISESKSISILDAGAGTARWTSKLLSYLPHARATLIDISAEMLETAKQNLSQSRQLERTTLLVEDLEQCDQIKDQTYDLVTCFHNVLGFNNDPIKAVNNLCQKTNQAGTLILVLPNYYHALYFSFQQQRWDEISRLQNSYSVKYTDQNPEILQFTPKLITELLQNNGFNQINIFGFPISVYPQLKGSTPINLGQHWNTLIQQETANCQQQEAAARGKHLLVIAKR